MSDNSAKHDHLAWAIRSRARNQECSLKLLRLFDDHPSYWRTKEHSVAAQELLAIAFSLWRAAFLAEKTGKRVEVFTAGRKFLASVIEDNAISYLNDKSSREWTFNYYTRNARYSLMYLAKHHEDLVPPYVNATRSPKERWDYCQNNLSRAIDNFEKLLSSRALAKEQKKKSQEVRAAAKLRKTKSRAVTMSSKRAVPKVPSA